MFGGLMGMLDNRKTIVTGAAQGIGRSIVDRFIKEGASVLAIDLKAMENLKSAYSGATSLTCLQLDITEQDAPAVMMHEVVERFGGLDVVVNNAGIANYLPISDTDDQAWNTVMELNLTAVFRICRESLTLLKKSSAGRIINIGSIMSTFGDAGLAAYAASKHGVAGLTKCLASELGEFGITANFIQPGAILTDITRDSIEKHPEMEVFWRQKSALGRWGEPTDIAPVALFLASDLGAFVSGTGLVADGAAMQAP
jgi:NAD(P)-dependent dehydrogenase (short-subunit alcohol dehydrogenase family)